MGPSKCPHKAKIQGHKARSFYLFEDIWSLYGYKCMTHSLSHTHTLHRNTQLFMHLLFMMISVIIKTSIKELFKGSVVLCSNV